MIRSEGSICSLGFSTSQPSVTEDVTNYLGRKGATSARDHVVTFSRLPSVEERASFPVASEWRLGICISYFYPHVFRKKKKRQTTHSSSRFDKHFGKVCSVGRMTSYKANTHVRAKIPTGRTVGCGEGQGKYAVNAASDKCSFCRCRYPVHDRTAENSVW